MAEFWLKIQILAVFLSVDIDEKLTLTSLCMHLKKALQATYICPSPQIYMVCVAWCGLGHQELRYQCVSVWPASHFCSCCLKDRKKSFVMIFQ